jgi:gliotoxin/aspirochlorine biosynthesis peptide synthetase
MGVVGEIHVAGIQVARGYLGLPEATAARFIRDPFCQEANERMFKTGDRGYWTDEGEIVCLGRNDRQIKLRGYRLDLDDLEIRASRAVEGIQSVAIVMRGDHLVAAVQPSTLDRNSVAAAFAKELPGYAQPRDIFLVDKFPTTRTGKLDYKQISSYHSQDFMYENDPLTSMEAEIARIWREILELDDSKCIIPTSNFLQLGGSSMLQMTLLVKLSSVLGTRVPLRLVIDSHSLRELAARLELLRDEVRARNGSPMLTTGPNKVSPLEKEWWSKYSLNPKPDTRCFNVSSVFRFAPESLNLELMEMAWNTTLARYPIFKSRYVRVEGAEHEVERCYAVDSPQVQFLQYADARIESNRMFDLESEPPIRVLLTNDQLLIVASHIVADIQTLKILFRDVKALYQGEAVPPPENPYELQPILKRDKKSCEFEFWSQYLKGVVLDKGRQPNSLLKKSFDGTSRFYRLSATLAKEIVRSPEEGYHLSLQQLAVAAIALVLDGDKDETDVVLGTPFTNRSTDAENNTVGLYLQPLPVRIQYSPQPGDADARPYLSEVRRTATAALAHAVPWHELLEHFNITPDYPNTPIFNVMVTFHTPDVAAKLDIPGLIPCFSWAEGSKFLLMTEFTALDTGDVMLRVEYDTGNYCDDDIDTFVANTTTALWMLLSDFSYSAIKLAMRSEERGIAMATLENDLLGRPWTVFQES